MYNDNMILAVVGIVLIIIILFFVIKNFGIIIDLVKGLCKFICGLFIVGLCVFVWLGGGWALYTLYVYLHMNLLDETLTLFVILLFIQGLRVLYAFLDCSHNISGRKFTEYSYSLHSSILSKCINRLGWSIFYVIVWGIWAIISFGGATLIYIVFKDIFKASPDLSRVFMIIVGLGLHVGVDVFLNSREIIYVFSPNARGGLGDSE